MTIKSDINKLVLDKKVNKELGVASVRPPIKSSNIVFRQEKSITGPSTDPTTGATTFPDPSSDSETTGTEPGFPSGSGSGTGVNTGSPRDVDADDLLNGLDGPQLPDTTSGETSNFSSPLGGITGLKDCATGMPVNVHTDGVFPVPAGWENGPPPADNYIAETYYRVSDPVTSSSIGYGATPILAAMNMLEGVAYIYRNLTVVFSIGFWFAQYEYSQDGGSYWPPAGATTSGMLVSTCPPEEVSDRCPISPPLETSWPPDGSYDIAFINGQYVVSPYDSEVPAGATFPTTELNLCTATDVPMTTEPAANGGYMVRPTIGGTTFVYNSDGTLRAAGDNTGSFNNTFRPR